MSTKPKTAAAKGGTNVPAAAPRQSEPAPLQPEADEVLTLAEAAAYLRVPETDVVRLAQQDLPGRLIGSEWRFLKAALRDWLRTSPPRGSKEAVLAVAGICRGDPYLEAELKEIYKRRGRPMTEDGE